jgi:hypothetical protein
MDFAMTLDYFYVQIAAIATVVVKVIQLLKPLYQERYKDYQKHIDAGLSVTINVVLCWYWQVDLFGLLGFYTGSVVGPIATGLIASLGSTVIHAVVDILERSRKQLPKPAPEGDK